MVVEDEFGIETAKKVNLKVSELMAPIIAKRIIKTLGLKEEKIQKLTKALSFIVWVSTQKMFSVNRNFMFRKS